MARPRAENPRTKFTNIRLTEEERAAFEQAAADKGYKNVSEYIRFLHETFTKEDAKSVPDHGVNPRDYPAKLLRSFLKTQHGEILWGDSRAYLFSKAAPASVDLIMTSPPFGLVRKKSYGNEDADQYCDWFRPFAEGFHRVLKDDGSSRSSILAGLGSRAANKEPLPFQTANDARRGIWVSLMPRALLVESIKTPHTGRMGQCSSHSCQRCSKMLSGGSPKRPIQKQIIKGFCSPIASL